ncbi:TlpA family protein disulfide reductase [Tumebacillus sp. ITR2]|uniref:TlpA family protein disulfide reductase n=1 Tax=Tumebacillus amylolyticus TaxID=2801339 RepID=A0ABS1J5M2_9BACL|nr:TlpA disulfide reductase family protein [Tumebacillus amylolyticus]MBL0385572.1 TlpA family protein disulfide reductase [Tumebacillus amylolyticus]
MQYRGLLTALLLMAVLAGVKNANGLEQNVASRNGTEPGTVASLPQPGYAAPDFILTDLEGRHVKMSELKGKKLFLNFWASWCPPCNDEMPDVVKLSQKYKGQVEFYGVNLTAQDKLEAARKFVETYKVNFPTLLDRNGDVARRYQAFAIPTTLTVDQNGIVVDRRNGQLSPTAMEGLIRNLVELK